jgi:hypothetical protein
LGRERLAPVGTAIVATASVLASTLTTFALSLGTRRMLSPFSSSPDPGSADREAFCSEAVAGDALSGFWWRRPANTIV